MEPDELEELVEELRKGSNTAYKQLYDEYYFLLYYTLFQHCRNEEITKDVVQTTFIRVYEHIDSLKKPQSLRSWMFQIAFNELRKIMRVENNKPYMYDDLGIEAYQKNFKNNLDKLEGIDKKLLIESIVLEVRKMDVRFQTVAILYYREKYSVPEIANILDIPSGTVKSRLHKINKTVKKALEKQGINPTIFYKSRQL